MAWLHEYGVGMFAMATLTYRLGRHRNAPANEGRKPVLGSFGRFTRKPEVGSLTVAK
jgi:hypothetical protein